MSLKLLESKRLASNKMFNRFADAQGQIVEQNQTFFCNRIDLKGRIIRLTYELWTHSIGKTCKVITSVKGEQGSRRIFKGKVVCRQILDKFKALPRVNPPVATTSQSAASNAPSVTAATPDANF